MNVLHITELYGEGGAYRIVEQLDNRLKLDHHKSFVICGYNKNNREVKKNHKILFNNSFFKDYYKNYKHFLEANKIIDVGLLIRLLVYIKNKKIDVIHFHALQGDYIGLAEIGILANLVPSVATLHDTWAFTGGCMHYWKCIEWTNDNCRCCKLLSKTRKAEDRSAIFSCKVQNLTNRNITFISPSDWMHDNVEKSMLRSEKRTIIHNGINTKVFYPKNEIELRKKYNIKDANRYVMFCASDIFSSFKGYNYLIKAISLLKNPEHYFLLIVGEGKIKKIKGIQIKRFGFVNELNMLNDIYNMADIFILPSLQDNFPCVSLEAMAAGTPVVAFPTGGIVNQFTEEEGWFTKGKSAKELAEKIEEAFEDREILKIKGEKSNQKCLERFDESQMYSEYLKVYRERILLTGDKKND